MTTYQNIESFSGADPVFLERGFICIKVWPVRGSLF